MAKQKTFAQQAKAITNKYKLRLGDKFDKGDPLALAAMNQELEALQQEQEAVRESQLGATPQFTNNEVFETGGLLPMFQGDDPNQSQFLPRPINASLFNQGIGGISNQMPFNPGIYDQLPGTSAEAMAAQTGSQPTAGGIGDGFQSRVPWLGAAAGLVGGLMANRKIDLPEYEYEEYKPQKATANLVDYSRGREQTMRERDQAQALITRGARGTGSQAGLMENILAGATGTQREAGTAFNRSLEQEANINAQIRNEVAARNAQQEAQAAQMNMRGKLYETQLGRESTFFEDQRRQNRIGAVTGAIQGYTKDRLAANQYDQMINMMAPDNYSVQADKDSLFRRLFQISPEQKISFRNTGDTAANV